MHFNDVATFSCVYALQFHWPAHIPDEKGVSDKKFKSHHWMLSARAQGAWMAGYETMLNGSYWLHVRVCGLPQIHEFLIRNIVVSGNELNTQMEYLCFLILVHFTNLITKVCTQTVNIYLGDIQL